MTTAYLLVCYQQAEQEIEHLQGELAVANLARREAEATIEGLGLELATAQRTIARLVARVAKLEAACVMARVSWNGEEAA